MTLEQALTQLSERLGLDAKALIAFAAEDRETGWDNGTGQWPIGSLFASEGRILYALVRAMRPQVIVEFGALYGCSAKHILKALAKNKSGKLISIDPDAKPMMDRFSAAEIKRWEIVREYGETALLPKHIDIAIEDTGHEISMTRDMCKRAMQHGAKVILVHDADHFGVGAKVREGMKLAFGSDYKIVRTADSDCGYGYWVRPETVITPVPVSQPHAAPMQSSQLLLSIVSGTFNRLPMLKAMIESVRDQLPRHFRYEFVLVDGGSTDGTIEWAEQQPDIRMIQHGELRGAIVSFCEGARAAVGDYVIMANDDVVFKPYSILRAIVHLEENRTCGAVAFADNRRAQMLDHVNHYHVVEKMPALASDGTMASVNYAQVGMFRRWLGNRCDWWGANDPIMSMARVYGGDNHLSSRIWEHGYSVDAVAGCLVDDQIAQDGLRDINRSRGAQDSHQYYARFPRGARLQPYPQVPNPQRERLRIVVMDAHAPQLPARTAKEKGLAEAFAEIGLVVHLDYVNEPCDLVKTIRAWQPHLLFTQMHGIGVINKELLQAARAECPQTVMVNFNGDVYEKDLIGSDILEALREVDLQTVVNAKVLPVYKRKGISATYWQIPYKESVAPYQGEVIAHDILWQGNCYNEDRNALIETLKSIRIGNKQPDLGIYGNCPDAHGSTHFDFAHQAALYSSAKITIGDTYKGSIAFTSNRMLQALGNGAFFLMEHSPELDKYNGWEAGIHYAEWQNLEDLVTKIKFWLQPEQAEARTRIAKAGQAFVRSNYSYPRQVEKLMELLPS